MGSERCGRVHSEDSHPCARAQRRGVHHRGTVNPELKTRILFTENGKPVEGLAVRAREDSEPVETDADGQVAVPLMEGRQTLRILQHGEWVPQIVQTNRESSLIVVDLAKKDTAEFLKPPKPDTSFLDIGQLNLGERYVYREIIGRGGMSVVLRAHDRLLNREVAVKVLSQELQAQPEAQQIFLTEARNLATLSHPNLVSVHDICKVDDQVFMVIEYVEGESLETLVAAVRGFNETVALQTAIQLARVVAYLHDHNIIHRDIKPANAMLRNDGTVKLIDFGLARHFDDLQVRGTRVRGTPAYMSPEQLTGEPLTPACDVYQLGVCLFEALSGRLPFSSKGDMGYHHVHTAAPSIHEFRPHVSDELEDLLTRCLSKNPAERPANGQELLRELQLIYQHTGGAGTNLYQQLREDAAESSAEATHGYSTSELRLMEAAGKHLRTSEFTAQSLSSILSDPNNQSRIVIQTGPRWSVIIGACVVTSSIVALAMYAMMKSQEIPREIAAPTLEIDREPTHEVERQPPQDLVVTPAPTPLVAQQAAETSQPAETSAPATERKPVQAPPAAPAVAEATSVAPTPPVIAEPAAPAPVTVIEAAPSPQELKREQRSGLFAPKPPTSEF